jgi:hypothetical protein
VHKTQIPSITALVAVGHVQLGAPGFNVQEDGQPHVKVVEFHTKLVIQEH